MMDWTELIRLARDRFRTQRVTAPMFLVAWAEHDADGHLARLTEPHGLGVDRLAATMLRILAGDEPEDEVNLVNECILRTSESMLTGRDLLACICAHPEHRVTRALAAAGLDIEGLGATLPETTPVGPVLARLSTAVDTAASALLKYGRDLTAEARTGAFDGYCDRPEDLDRLATVLMRMDQGNPALIGEAGVGKTALVELLAREIVAGRIAGIARETRVFEVRIGSMVAGTRYRGDFEGRLEDVIRAVVASAPAFLFLDEAHLMFGAGRAEGAPIDLGNMLKPRLARGDLRVIAATTAQEFNMYIAQDEALARRFTEVRLSEPSPELTARMVRTRAAAIAAHHGVGIAEGIIARAIALTDEHLQQKLQPYKTINLLDTAAVRIRRMGRSALDEETLLQTLSELAGRDIEETKGSRRKALRGLEDFLAARIIGQEEAIEEVVGAVIRQRQRLGNPERNIGSFLFLGPTGVGKTELGRQLAHGLFAGARDLLHLDMSEYAEPSSLSKLMGAPAGYVGADREGVLIRWLQDHPAGGVLLFDEIEKAHRDIHNLLLGLLDNGRIHSARGKTMDCRHCIVIMTSNAISTEDLSKGPLGFGGSKASVNPADLLTREFPREFLGRLDDIILFRPLRDDDLQRIVRLRLDEAAERLRRRRIRLSADLSRLGRHLAGKIESARSGARGVERLIEQVLLTPISLATLSVEADGPVDAIIGDAFYETGVVDVRAGIGDSRPRKEECHEDS